MAINLFSDSIQKTFAKIYGNEACILKEQNTRYENLLSSFEKRYNKNAERLFSSPGRSEISGNHTDHNLGKVLATSINLDCIGAVTKTDDGIITISDLTYNEDYSINTSDTARIDGEKGSIALVRGIVEGFKQNGFKVGGFSSLFTSSVIAAAGVSSSASFEMIICTILNNLYNESSISVAKLAQIGQFAENKYWDKKSGLLDQMACATGGLIQIDFETQNAPVVNQVAFDFAKENYALMIVNTGKSHADLSEEYSSIPNEMKSVAKFFGKDVLRNTNETDLISNMMAVREKCGDRAVLRALHFYEENKRVDQIVNSLVANDFKTFLKLIIESGNSSWKWLQNAYIATNEKEQSIPVCLALTEMFIQNYCPMKSERPGACRIHGGGFAGVIMALLPKEFADEYRDYMHKALNVKTADKDPVYEMSVRPLGSIEIK